MKLIFLSTSYTTVYLIRYKYRLTYDKEHDSFRVAFLIIPCAVLALLINQTEAEMTFFGKIVEVPLINNSLTGQILWTFSIYLEAVAILPQLFLLQRTGEVENLTSDYIFMLGSYRALYLLNWIYRYMTEPGYVQWIVWISGLVQTGLYCDFFYYYVIRSGFDVVLEMLILAVSIMESP